LLKIPILKRREYQEHLKRFIDRIVKRPDVIGILIFGSIARGLEKPFPESDIDVLIIAKNLPKNIAERRIENLKYKIDAEAIEDIWLTPEELLDGIEGGWGVLLDAMADGVIIYDREGILLKARKIVYEKYRRIGRIWVL